MSFKEKIYAEYFEWLLDLVCENRPERELYLKLLTRLHQIEFVWFHVMDENRASDGVNLRRRFAAINGYEDVIGYLDEPCSVLEMMVGLAVRCEEWLMDNPHKGNRTSQWFWDMVINMNLAIVIDDEFDIEYVDSCVNRMLERQYDYDGTGGLFRVRNPRRDMRDIEIWAQLAAYINQHDGRE